MFNILLWICPIFILQLNYNKNIILNNSKLILDSIIYSSIYLIIIDKFAIDNFTWIINKNYTINFFTDYIATIPLEEIIFFIVTSTMCNLGFTLFMCII